jgi:hypothetical protein
MNNSASPGNDMLDDINQLMKQEKEPNNQEKYKRAMTSASDLLKKKNKPRSNNSFDAEEGDELDDLIVETKK